MNNESENMNLHVELVKAHQQNQKLMQIIDNIKPTELRDKFAAAALQGIISRENPTLRNAEGDPKDHLANAAYTMADAMLKARKEK